MIVDRHGLIEELSAGLAMIGSHGRGGGDRSSDSLICAGGIHENIEHGEALSGNAQTFQCRITTLQGSVRWIESYVVPFGDEPPELPSVLMVAKDITDSRKMEAQLQQALKMEAVCRSAGGVAHDFNIC